MGASAEEIHGRRSFSVAKTAPKAIGCVITISASRTAGSA